MILSPARTSCIGASVVLLVALVSGCAPERAGAPGTYHLVRTNPEVEGFSSNLILEPDGRFAWITRRGDQDESRGSYIVQGNEISFSPTSWTTSRSPRIRGEIHGADLVLVLIERDERIELTYRKP
jgi:hypothetical protein